VVLLYAAAISLGVEMKATGAAQWVAESVFLGMRAYARIDERRFRQVVLMLLLASGTALVLS
jgi:di/tricarboxylate transporter